MGVAGLDDLEIIAVFATSDVNEWISSVVRRISISKCMVAGALWFTTKVAPWGLPAH
jgi:hypothetical protein